MNIEVIVVIVLLVMSLGVKLRRGTPFFWVKKEQPRSHTDEREDDRDE